jgi:hypothetical protein
MSTALGFALAAVLVGGYFRAVQPSDGAPMGMFPFVLTIVLGICIIMTTQVVVSTSCYLVGDFLRTRDRRR